ncbi:MAG: hypothetical protein ACMXYD_04815 [Candidatus Woesearchaeota archaeon]
MLRKLILAITILLAGVLLLPEVTANTGVIVVADSTGVVYDFGQIGTDGTWSYRVGTGPWQRVDSATQLDSDTHNNIINELQNKNALEGYRYLDQLDIDPRPVWASSSRIFVDSNGQPPNPPPTIDVQRTQQIGSTVQYRFNRDQNQWEWRQRVGGTAQGQFGTTFSSNQQQRAFQNALNRLNEHNGYLFLEAQKPEVHSISGLPTYISSSDEQPQETSEETDPITITIEGVELTYEFRFGRWTFSEDGRTSWINVNQSSRVPEEHREIANNLDGETLPAGLAFLQEFKRSQETTPEQTPRPELEETTTSCGIIRTGNAHYMELCYDPNMLHPRQPRYEQRAISNFLQAYHEAGDSQAGYAIISFAQDQGIANSRAQEITSSLRAIARANRFSIVTIKKTSESSNFNNKVYIIPQRAVNNLGDVLSAANLQGVNITEKRDDLWKRVEADLHTDKTVRELIDSIESSTGVKVQLVPTLQDWDLRNRNSIENMILNVEGIDRINVCTAYILYNEDKVDLYQSTRYCNLRVHRNNIWEESPREQIIRLLQSAELNTRRDSSEQLMLVAYHLVTERAELGDESEGIRLAEWAYDNPTPQDRRDNMQQINASKTIVRAQDTLLRGHPNTTLKMLQGDVIENAHRRMQPLGARTLLEAARQVGDCRILSQEVQRVSAQLPALRLVRDYRQEIRECAFRELKESCEIMQPSETTALRVTYINEGLSRSDFIRYTDEITNSLLRTPNIDTYRNHIEFKRANTSVNQITTTQGLLQPPRINSRALTDVARACYGDHIVVLSENEYHPVVHGGSTYLSVTACREDPRCMTIYAARGMAFGVFGMQEEAGTVTARLSTDPRRSTLAQVFSATQQQIIRQYFEART